MFTFQNLSFEVTIDKHSKSGAAGEQIGEQNNWWWGTQALGLFSSRSNTSADTSDLSDYRQNLQINYWKYLPGARRKTEAGFMAGGLRFLLITRAVSLMRAGSGPCFACLTDKLASYREWSLEFKRRKEIWHCLVTAAIAGLSRKLCINSSIQESEGGVLWAAK